MTELDPGLPAPSAEETVRHNRSTLLAQTARVGGKLVSVVIVARLVAPAEYGLFAMAGSVTLFLFLFRDAGLGTASTQVASLSEPLRRTLFAAHLLLGFALAALTLALAPLAVRFYATPALAPLLATLSVAFVFIGIGGFPRSQLVRSLRFAAISQIDTITAVVSVAVMIAAAALGAGAYSFAAFMLVSEALSAALAWRAYRWTPRLAADFRALRGLMRTGAHVTGYHVLSHLTAQVDTFAVGRALGAHVLGLYNRPLQLLALGQQHIVWPLSQVAFATLSRLVATPHHFSAHAARSITVTAHFSLPFLTISLILPAETVHLLLGDQWSEAAALLRLLAVSATANTVMLLGYGVTLAAGRAPQLFGSALVSLPLTAAAVLIGLRHGAAGVAAALAAINLGLLLPRLWWTLRGTPLPLRDFARALAGPISVNLAFGLGLAAGRGWFVDTPWSLRLGAALCTGLAAVGLVCTMSLRLRREALELLAHLPGRKLPASSAGV